VTLLVAALVAGGILLWPTGFGRRRLAILPGAPSSLLRQPGPMVGSWWGDVSRWGRPRRAARVSPTDLLGLLEAVGRALDAGMAPAAALRVAAECRDGSGPADPVAMLVGRMASAAADGAALGPLWLSEAGAARSPELLLLAHAWSLTEDIGAPLSQAVHTTVGLLEARAAHERRLAAAVAGARATVNLLTVLPIGGPLVAMVLGIGPAELFMGSGLTQGCLLLGICLAMIGRWWVRQMVRAVAHGPVIA